MSTPLSLKDRIAAYDRETQSAPQSTGVSPSAIDTSPAADAPDLAASHSDGSPRAESPFSNSPDSYASSAVSDDPASSLDGMPLIHPIPAICRANEHLAVLLPRAHWKRDNQATSCDKYACHVRFSLFERRHHCRKCGGIYCRACSARTTPLLDTTRLAFLFPPKNTPIAAFAAPNAPVVDARVCDECFEQLHGYPTPRPRPAVSASTPSSPRATARGVPLAHSSSTISTLSPTTPPDGRPLLQRSHSAIPVAYSDSPIPQPLHPADTPAPPKKSRPYYTLSPPVKTTKLEGDLDRYPLKDPSATCKAAGGGRWEPKRYPLRWDGRLPDGRIRYEVEAEKMEEAKARRRANPVIVDGEIRVRKLRPPPAPERGGPYKLPTF